MGSLVTGTADPQTSIRPLHASFYDFPTDKSRSGKFFVDVSFVKRDLAFASLRVMRTEPRFNICSLESSYQPNSAVINLETRVKKLISAELSYSCRFWGTRANYVVRTIARYGSRSLFRWRASSFLVGSTGTNEGSQRCSKVSFGYCRLGEGTCLQPILGTNEFLQLRVM
jgi:hypothetical protein